MNAALSLAAGVACRDRSHVAQACSHGAASRGVARLKSGGSTFPEHGHRHESRRFKVGRRAAGCHLERVCHIGCHAHVAKQRGHETGGVDLPLQCCVEVPCSSALLKCHRMEATGPGTIANQPAPGSQNTGRLSDRMPTLLRDVGMAPRRRSGNVHHAEMNILRWAGSRCIVIGIAASQEICRRCGPDVALQAPGVEMVSPIQSTGEGATENTC